MKIIILTFISALACLLSFPASAQNWQVGDKAFLLNTWNDVQNKYEFVMVEIDDVRGDRVKVIARAACNDNGWAGKGCNTGWFPSYDRSAMQMNDSKWVRKSDLLTSWEDKVRKN